MSERPLPHSLDAERAVLGAVLAYAERWPDAAAVLTGDEFYRAAHQTVWDAMRQLKTDAVTIDFLTVKELLARKGTLDGVGGPAYLAALTDAVPRSANVAHYAGVVKEQARLRALIAAGQQIVADAEASGMPADAVLEAGTRALLRLAVPTETDATPIGQAVANYLTTLDTDAASLVTPTGYADVDDLLAGGFRHGDLTIVAARPSVGKTAFALWSAITAAQKGKPSVFFSLEMSRDALVARAVSGMARVSGYRIAKRTLSPTDYEKILAAVTAFEAMPLLVHDAAQTLTQIAAWVERLQQRPEGLACVVVDYLQLLLPEGRRTQGRHEDVAAISRGLKRLARESNVALVALSQLSRAPEARTDKRPHLSDLRESGALEQDADVAILLFREEMHKPTDENSGVAEAIVAKHRNGPTGVTRLAFLKDLMKFENLAGER